MAKHQFKPSSVKYEPDGKLINKVVKHSGRYFILRDSQIRRQILNWDTLSRAMFINVEWLMTLGKLIDLKKLQLCTQEHSNSRLKTHSASGSVALQCWMHTIVPISNLILEQQQCFTALQSAIITISLWITMSITSIWYITVFTC